MLYFVHDFPARLGDPPGICGSGATIDEAVRSATREIGVEVRHAYRVLAHVMGQDIGRGRYRAGITADDRTGINAIRTWMERRESYGADPLYVASTPHQRAIGGDVVDGLVVEQFESEAACVEFYRIDDEEAAYNHDLLLNLLRPS